MPDYNGEAATVLPNYGPSMVDALQYQRDEPQRQQAQQYREDQKRSQAASRKLQLLNHVESTTDPKKFLIGESTIDQHTTTQLESVKSDMLKYMQQNPDADPTDVAYQIQQKVSPIAIAHAKQQAISQDIDKNLALAKSDLPVLNDGKLRNAARQQAFLKQLPDGSFTYKDPEEMNSSTNYVQNVINNSPESVVDNEQPFIKNLQALKTERIKGKKGDMFAGVRTKNSYDAQVSPFRELDVDEKGNVNGLRYKQENITLPGGDNQIAVAPQEQFDLATADPNAKLAFYKLWNENKGKYGVGNLDNNDPTSKIMQRKFLLDYLKDTNIDHSSYSSDDEVYKNKAASDVEAGYGTPEEQYARKQSIAHANQVDMEDIRNQHIIGRQATGAENRKILKQTPGAKSVRLPAGTTAPAKKTISRSDIPTKAKAQGYTNAEYEQLLKNNGVEIKD